ncbi:nucleotidyltransferase domain-containing protein [Flavisolibacter sp. BT320]|nr:nucleotidyltransferase domain-containing protein [Flavisolibacter longurius]
MTIQKDFAERTVQVLSPDESVTGIAVAGSWLTNEMDEYSDLDLVLVTKEKVGGDRTKMLAYANRLGDLLSGFTGEHVGEPRVLICLYDNPLLHVDVKFVTAEEFGHRVENPEILFDRKGQLSKLLEDSEARFPYPDYQWIEDRFWTWVHYALLKIGRGELLEAFDFLGYLRMVVLGPLLHIRNNRLPRGVRKVETQLLPTDFEKLKSTIPVYTTTSLLESLNNAVSLYKELRYELYTTKVLQQTRAEEKVAAYFVRIQSASQ